MQLVYFDIPGRAETARLALELGGVQYEDVKFPFEDWPKYKAASPNGKCPYMIMDDGTKFSESLATKVVSANMAGMWPSDLGQQGKVMEILALLQTLESIITPVEANASAEDKPAKRKELFMPGGKAHDVLAIVDKLLGSSKTKYYLGDEPGVVDLDVFTGMGFFTSGVMDGLDSGLLPTIEKTLPNIKATRDKVAAEPKVAQRYEGKDGEYKAFQ